MLQQIDLTQLRHRISYLEETYLPAPDPMGRYSSFDYDQLAAYLLLLHAEVEWFIERRCLAVADAAVSGWTIDSAPRSTVTALVAFAHASGSRNIPVKVGAEPPRIRKVVKEAKNNYSDAVDDNHGLKEENLLALLLPIGVREHQLSSEFREDMNALGTWRGDQAHRGLGARALPDPREVSDTTGRIVEGLSNLDRSLEELMKEQVITE